MKTDQPRIHIFKNVRVVFADPLKISRENVREEVESVLRQIFRPKAMGDGYFQHGVSAFR